MLDLQKERNKRRQLLIRKAWAISRTLEAAATTIQTRVTQVKNHEISEWDLTEATQQEILQLFVEVGLTELWEAFLNYALTNQALAYGSKETT
jgi:hypothetical protein